MEAETGDEEAEAGDKAEAETGGEAGNEEAETGGEAGDVGLNHDVVVHHPAVDDDGGH